MTGAPLARVTPEERIVELEKALAEQAAELERLRTALKQKDEALDAWKRGHRSRPGGKKAQRSTDSARPKRAPGRAAGHAGCSRRAPARVDREVLLPPPECCPDCGSNVEVVESRPRRMVVEELREQPAIEAVAFVRPQGRCSGCSKRVLAPLPESLGANAKIGPRIQARMVEQKAEGLSLGQIQREAARLGVRVSRGGIQQILHRSAEVLRPLHEQMRLHIRGASHLWMDETPHRVGASNGWLWMARTKTVVWFVHALSRSKDVVHSMLGTRFEGVIHSDLYGAYFTVEGARHAVCWAHTIRTAREITERTQLDEARELYDGLRRLYARSVRSQQRPATSARNARAIGQDIRTLGRDERLRVHPDIERLQGRLRRRVRELTYFITDPAAEGTNNFSERTLRPHAMSRARCGPARSERGAQTYAVNLSAVQTMAACRSSFETLLLEARACFFRGLQLSNAIQRFAPVH
jgi:transposase